MIYQEYIDNNAKEEKKITFCEECGNAPDFVLETSPFSKKFICMDCASQLRELIKREFKELKRKVDLYK